MKLSLKTSSIFAAIAISIYCVYTILLDGANYPRYHYLLTSLYIDKFLTFRYNWMIWVTLMLVAIALLGVSLFVHRKYIPQLSKSLLWQARIIVAILSLLILYNVIRQIIGPIKSLMYFEYLLQITDCIESTLMYNSGLMVLISIWLWQFAFYHPKNFIESNAIGYSGLAVAILVSAMAILRLVFPGSLSNIWTSWLIPISAYLLFLVSLIEQRKNRNHCKNVQSQDDLTTQILHINPNHQTSSQKNSQNELLLRFFRNETDDAIPHRHEDIVVYDDNQMEMYHDFIQWIFPTKRPSIMHPEAPIIDENFAEMLCADKCARKNYCKSCQRYLNYMNFDCNGDSNIIDSTRDMPFYKLPYHNFLRITRMLDSLNQTGHQQCSNNLYKKMFELLKNAPLAWIPHDDTLQYWKNTQQLTSRKIIFLDLDGVMDNAKYDIYLNKHNLPEKDEFGVLFDPDCIAALAHIVEQTGADIVISSSWKDYMTMDEIHMMWHKRQLPGKVIDVTPTTSRHRGDEIATWLNLCPDTCSYVIIDDQPREQFNTDQYDHLIITNGFYGLTQSDAERAVEILNN